MRDMRFEFKLSEGEYLRLKKTAFVLGMTMADLIRDSLDLKCAEMEGREPIIDHWMFRCPCCKSVLRRDQKFCHECGKRVMWDACKEGGEV